MQAGICERHSNNNRVILSWPTSGYVFSLSSPPQGGSGPVAEQQPGAGRSSAAQSRLLP